MNALTDHNSKIEATRLMQIRESERMSHITMYSDSRLYQEGSWLRKPIKTVVDLFPFFDGRTELRILDLGCGVGRNCISAARHFSNISCQIDCIDILDFAIQKLMEYAKEYNVFDCIHPFVDSIDTFFIPQNHYDCIMAISSLEHVDSKESFRKKISEIRDGLRSDGIVCLVINSSISEYDLLNGHEVFPQFEVNFSSAELQKLLENTFAGWEIMKSRHQEQSYEIPRETGMHKLQTTVVTFVARKA